MPRGGRRPGAGRPKGSGNALPLGTVTVLNTARIAERRLEARKDATPEDKAIVERVYERVAAVLEGKVHHSVAPSVLKAGAMVADAVAGPMAQKLEIKDERAHARLAFSVADRVLGPQRAAGDHEIDVTPAPEAAAAGGAQ
jgi:hypothetical protein